jgi:ADP-dependent NAD(P)H-hydrate dehydratase / NAD(P)H-hydrate epimerase
MIPVVTPEEMAAIDADAHEPVEELIGRAGAATAAAALELMDGAYGRRVVVIAGKGHNGDDGRDAARRLERRGVRCRIVDLDDMPERIEGVDLVIDAALGTGARPGFAGPEVADGVPVLAVDLPSGLDGRTGVAGDGVLRADRTVTFAALKPGLLLGDGPGHSGEVTVVDIGLDTSRATAGLVTDDDARALLPERSTAAHKWRSAVWVIAGSPGMLGAAHLCTRAAQRAGAGYVRLSSPGVDEDPRAPTEAVGRPLGERWAREVLADQDRIAAVAVGPGLGRSDGTASQVLDMLAGLDRPVVVDGDGLAALGVMPSDVLAARTARTVLTPHDGELRGLLGAPPDADRTQVARDLAAASRATVLLKGPTTVVADPSGQVRYVTSGDARLATAGTGDVLTGIIAALLAQGMEPLDAAAVGAHLHGRAGAVGSARGLVAGDLPDLLPHVFDQI